MNTELINKINNNATILGNKSTPKSITPKDNGGILLDTVTVFENNERDMCDFTDSGLNTSSKVIVNAINEVNDKIGKKAGLDDKGLIKTELINPLWGEQMGANFNKKLSNAEKKQIIDVLDTGSYTIEVVFRTGTDVINQQSIYDTNGDAGCPRIFYNNSTLNIMYGDFTLYPIKPNTYYQVIVVVAGDNKIKYVNSKEIYNKNITISNTSIGFAIGYTINELDGFKGSFSLFRVFNYPLSPEEVKTLWNNGKPLEYRLGNEMFGENNALTIDKLQINTSDGQCDGVLYNIDGVDCYKFENKSDRNGALGYYYTIGSRFKYYNLLKITTRVYLNASRNLSGNSGIDTKSVSESIFDSNKLNEWQDVVIYAYNNNVNSVLRVYFDSTILGGFMYITDCLIETCNCTFELLPTSMTPNILFDTSASKNHIQLTNPAEIIYNKPYKSCISENKAPDVVPDFVGQKWINKTAKTAYISTDTNTISDWKLVTI